MTEHHKWSEQETEKLIEAIRLHGLDWRSIHQYHFPHLTPQIVKNKYYKKQKNDKNGSIKEFMESTEDTKVFPLPDEFVNENATASTVSTGPSDSATTITEVSIPDYASQKLSDELLDEIRIALPEQKVEQSAVSNEDWQFTFNQGRIEDDERNLRVSDFGNRPYSIPWTRNQSLPMTAEMSLLDENELNEGIDSKQLDKLLLELPLERLPAMLSPPMLSPTREKSDNK